MKKDYRGEIHALFEQMRSEMKLENTLDLLKFKMLESREEKALERNSREVIKEIKESIKKQKQKTVILKHAGKKVTIKENGKIRVTPL